MAEHTEQPWGCRRPQTLPASDGHPTVPCLGPLSLPTSSSSPAELRRLSSPPSATSVGYKENRQGEYRHINQETLRCLVGRVCCERGSPTMDFSGQVHVLAYGQQPCYRKGTLPMKAPRYHLSCLPPTHPESHRLRKRQSPGWALDSPLSSTRWCLCPLGWEGRPPKVSTPSQRCPRTHYTAWRRGLYRRRGHRSKNGETLDLLGGPILITGALKSREPSPAGSRKDGRRGGQRSGLEDPACC